MAKPNPRVEAAKARIARFEQTGIYEVGDDVKLIGTSLKGKIVKIFNEEYASVKVPNFGEMVRHVNRFEFIPPYTGFYRRAKTVDAKIIEPPTTSDGFPVVFQRKDSRKWPVTRSQ